ncbi:paraneoplastic antigen Ma3 homolog [Pseudophryne corroboree]|uniref:paraneoplastic antigen Ma3 homolog n=1 Tax=Pseudophryne corroboree TaxID=495146 RepID=UPI003081B76D
MEVLTGEDVYVWGQTKKKDPNRCIVIGGDFVGFSDEDVVGKTGALYGITRPIIVDKRRGEAGESVAILIEIEKELDANLIPHMMMADENMGKKWRIILPVRKENEVDDTGPSGAPVNISEKGKGDSNVTGGQFETIVDRVVSQLERWHYEGSYRRLRIFSGIVPVPTGEESYEAWKEAAVQQAEEWQCPDQIKRQRVVESLRGPAMGIVQAARRSNPNATLETYLEALDYAYGTLEDVGDLISRLHHTFQEPGEKLSSYVIRVDKLLYKIVDKGGISREEVDKSRMKQLLRGALTTDSVAQKLRCSGTREPVPAFNELLKEVKQEEALIEMREKTIKKIKVVQSTTEINSLEDKLLKMMEEQNKKIDQFIATYNAHSSSQNNSPNENVRGKRNTFSNRGCFKCGRFGHRAFECNINQNISRVPNNSSGREDADQGNGGGRPVDPTQAS